MVTTVHIPRDLLKAVDAHAKRLQISRNKLIVQALENDSKSGSGWPLGFFKQFKNPDTEQVSTVDEMMDQVKKSRRSRMRPPQL
jgi:predicted transcriptional regulator